MHDCYLEIKNLGSSLVPVYVTVTEIPGPLFYYAERVSTTGESSTVNSPSGQGLLKQFMVSGGSSMLSIDNAPEIAPFGTNVGTNTNTNNTTIYSDLNIGINSVNGVFADNSSITYASTVIFMGIEY